MTRLPTAHARDFLPAALLVLLLSACAQVPERPADTVTKGAYQEVGMASWYGASFQGRPTASGEPFDMNALTAAHPSLPFGTRVRVTNLANGRSVVLRINDRGPYKKRRIIDVSRRAAAHLGFLRAGLAKVRVEVI